MPWVEDAIVECLRHPCELGEFDWSRLRYEQVQRAGREEGAHHGGTEGAEKKGRMQK
jgi:hypothetical protein